MRLRAFGATDVGRVKDRNEDAYFLDPDDGLFIVADGMGGHAAGEVASEMAVDLVSQALLPWTAKMRELAAENTPDGRKQILQRIEDAVHDADRAIFERGQANRDERGMGTTLDVVLVTDGECFIAHVGDSRVYLVRGNDASQLTTDHTLGNLLITQGKMAPEELATFPQKHTLVRALGLAGGTVVDRIHFDLLGGDRLVLCSDGLANYITTAGDLRRMADAARAMESGEPFIKAANDRGGADNITAVLVEIDQPVVARRTLETNLKLRLLERVPLFRGLTPQELYKILPLTRERIVVPDELVMRENDAGGEMFVVLEGGVEVESGGVVLASLGPGSQVGELALVDNHPRSATVKARVPSRLLELRRQEFQELTGAGDGLASKLLWNLVHEITDRLRTTTWQLSEQVRAHALAQP